MPASDRFFIVQTPLKSDPSGSGIGVTDEGPAFYGIIPGKFFGVNEMKWTKTFIQTLRENPQDAEIDSHKLLVRAGICRKTASGLFMIRSMVIMCLRQAF